MRVTVGDLGFMVHLSSDNPKTLEGAVTRLASDGHLDVLLFNLRQRIDTILRETGVGYEVVRR